MQQVMFLKNISMLGAALLIAYFGAGPLSFDKETKPKSVRLTYRAQTKTQPSLQEY
jgi:hypothetical protein